MEAVFGLKVPAAVDCALTSIFSDLRDIECVRVLVDNKAAITVAECGASWRTRYFSVRGHRLHEEISLGRLQLEHCKTDVMVADGLTKLASPVVLEKLREAMSGKDFSKAQAKSARVNDVSTSEAPSDRQRGARFVRKNIYIYLDYGD